MVFLNEISVMHLGCSLVITPMREPKPELRINAFIISYYFITVDSNILSLSFSLLSHPR